MNKLPLVEKIFRPKTLLPPTVLLTTNHLLVVNKSPGWLTVPTDDGWDPKCLVGHLQKLKLGGGSNKEWLNPLHRIDQPCSGLVVLGKTKRACQRIQPLWRAGKVKKTYLVVLSEQHNPFPNWTKIGAHMIVVKKGAKKHLKQTVQFTDQIYPNTKYCELTYRSLSPTVIQVTTNQGARHMVRGLLGYYGYRIAGDLRYGANQALEDQSVALHAQSITFPPELALGNLETKYFEAPIPKTWKKYFGVTQDQVTNWIQDNEK